MLTTRLLRLKYPLYSPYIKRNKYYVLLPQVPDDTPESNSLLRTSSLPVFSDLTTEKCINAIGKLVIQYESGIHHLGEKLYDPNLPKTVESVIMPLDRLSVPLDFAWATFKLLYILGTLDSITDAYSKLYPRILKAKQEQYLSLSIYHAFKELKADEKLLAEPVQRIVDKHLLESRLSGINLSTNQNKQYQNIVLKLNDERIKYRQNLMNCTAKFSQQLSMNDVRNFPKDFIKQIAADPSNILNGPWYVTLSPKIYLKFMELCDDRLLRWNVWNAKNVRASAISGRSLNNSVVIEEIRAQRREQAKILGFESFTEMSMATKMAKNFETVIAMVTTLRVKTRAAMLKEIDELQAFAAKEGFEHSLELWDVPYWQRRHKEHLFGLDENAVRQYFPFPVVLKGLFEFCHKLFNVNIVRDNNPNIDLWHKDVSYYKILDQNGTSIASFYLDPYSRPNEKAPGAWMELGRNKSEVCGTEPLSFLIFNFSPPESKTPSLLSFEELKTLLQKFGHLLQHSLSTIPYSEVAGITNLEWDVVQVAPYFFSSWLTHFKTTASLSSHVETGCKIPEELHMKLVKSKNYMSALRLNEELYLSALDLELYSSRDYWVDIMKRFWSDFIPFPLDKNQAHVCSFPQIFCDDFPAAYFSFVWAKMIAADIYSAFKEGGLDNEEGIKVLGQRFRETYLSLGGGSHPSEVFRRFRGRDPSADALLSRYGLCYKPSAAKSENSEH